MANNRNRVPLNYRKSILVSSSCLALLAMASGVALAQETETVVVSGSRIVTNGMQAPTPVTVVTTEQLQMAAPRNINEALVQLPVFKGSTGVQTTSTGTTGSNGSNTLNMRSLGGSRTLVMMDSRRIVPAYSDGGPDIAQIPESLVQRVDVVTGGASAAYGSDAVAGVVNFILNTKYEGIKVDAQGGVSGYGDNLESKVSFTYGGSFLGDRLHIISNALNYESSGVTAAKARPWTDHAISAIVNPAVTASNPKSPTNPATIMVEHPYGSNAALGGLITDTVLKGTTFDSNGTPRQFTYGSLVSSTQMSGGDGYNPSLELGLQPHQHDYQVFFHGTYDITNELSAFFQVTGAQNHVMYRSLPAFELSSTNWTILADNAYLPASIKSTMTANKITLFHFGRISPDLAIPFMDAIRNTGMLTAGFDGKWGNTWSYHGYAQIGRTFDSFKTSDDPISDNQFRASDAVVDPATGRIVCRQSLSNPAATAISNPVGCVPLDVFGVGTSSEQARKYMTGTAIQTDQIQQDVTEVSASGEVFDLPAGAVSVAVGGGFRRELFKQLTDAQSQEVRTGAGIGAAFPVGLVNSLGGFERTNPQPAGGGFNVWEAFVEAEVPLLRDAPMAKSLSVNLAGRYVEYSISGGVEPWKIGVVYEPFDGLRFRAARSTDIRAPNLGEFFRGSSQGTATINDPFRSGASVTVLTGSVGNPYLTPEVAVTSTYGVVASPDFMPGLSLSVDYYRINITQAIATVGAQMEVDFCYQGSQVFCNFLSRGPGGVLSRIEQPFFNAAARFTQGIDWEASYNTDLSDWSSDLDGTLNMRMIGNYVGEYFTQARGAAVVQLAGDIGQSNPKWEWHMSANYTADRFGLYIQERFIGGGKYDNTKTPSDVDKNNAPDVFYTDVTLNYDILPNKVLTGFFSMNNAFDKDPPPTPGFLITGASYGNRSLYDIIGRQFTLGVHYRTN